MRPGTHVGINAVFLEGGMGGLETYVRELLPQLVLAEPCVRFSVFASSAGEEWMRSLPWASEVSVVTHPLLGRRPLRALSEMTLLATLARRRGVDLLHSVGMTGPLTRPPVHVVQVSDLIWLTHSDPADRVTAALWRATVPVIARRAARVITLSHASKGELTRRLHLDERKIDVVPLGPGRKPSSKPTPEACLRRGLDLGEGPLVLAVAAKRRHKNLATLIDALPAVLQAVPDVRLVLPGKTTPHEIELREAAEHAGVAEAVVFPPYVSDENLEGLYAAAACFVFPSFVEGFGLPILEAMRRGVPVACAGVSAPAEVAGDAALLFDPHRPSEVAEAILALLTDAPHAKSLARLGRTRAESFSWRATAEGTLESWERGLR